MNILAAMRPAALAGLMAALLVTSPASAGKEAQSRVSIDWRSVRDSDIQRCGLSRLRAGTLERLVDEGHAVVDSADSTGVRVRVTSVAAGLHIHVESSATSREETLRLPETCDATLVLEAISRIAELVRIVGEDLRLRPPPAPTAAVEPHADSFSLSLDAAAKLANPREFLLFGGGVGLGWALPSEWELGARAELLGNARHEVTVIEASTAVTAGWQPARSILGLQLEAGPLLHLGTSEQLTAREIDGALGAGLKLRAGLLRAQLLGYVRLRRFEHQIDGQVAFDTGQVGLILRIGVQLLGS
jgi:hypothetical protein